MERRKLRTSVLDTQQIYPDLHAYLTGCSFCHPTHNSLDALNPHFQLHPGHHEAIFLSFKETCGTWQSLKKKEKKLQGVVMQNKIYETSIKYNLLKTLFKQKTPFNLTKFILFIFSQPLIKYCIHLATCTNNGAMKCCITSLYH